jgi:hypothetical protein
MTTLDRKAQAAADKAGQVAFIAKFGGVGSLRIHAALGAGIEAAITAYLDALSSLPAQAGNGFLTDGPADPDQYAAYVTQELKRPLAERLRLITHVGPYHLRNTPNEAADALSPSSQPAAAVEADLLAKLGENISLELSWGPWDGEIESECFWRVHERRGNRNDQEWDLLGYGRTPADAIRRALEAALRITP